MTKLKQTIIEILENLKEGILADYQAMASKEIREKRTEKRIDLKAQKIIEVVEEDTKSIYCDGCGKLIKIPTVQQEVLDEIREQVMPDGSFVSEKCGECIYYRNHKSWQKKLNETN